MKASEILRKLADVMDQYSSEEAPANSVPHAELEPVEVDNTDNAETSTPIPPLQAKIELLKKSQGLDNAYDDAKPCPCDSDEDAELALIKQRAGVPVIAIQDMIDDEPFEG